MTDAHGPLDIPGHRYERLLGSGGFADVHLYTQELLGRPVAVKIMREQVAHGAARQQFMTEANLMARLASHPSIVTILSADVSDSGRPYIVMEYCSRPGLAQRYQSRPLSVDETLQTMVRLSGAIETAHRAGILHRDIKPANVLTTDYGWPALTDFGISAIIGEGTIGEGGMSVPWSPPEAFTGASRLDERSDVYSLAATAYTLLAGHSPFDDEVQGLNMSAFVYRILEAPVAEIPRADIPQNLQRLLAVSMAKEPDNRPPTAAQFARALQRIERELGLPVTPLDVPDTIIEDLERTQTQMRRTRPDATVGPDATTDASPAPAPEPVAQDDEIEPTVVAARPVVAIEDEELESTIAISRPPVAPPAPVVEEEADERTVAFDRADDATVVLDRAAEDRTLLIDRTAGPVAEGAPAATRSTDVPARSGRIAYVPDPEHVARYKARRETAAATPVRRSYAPPPQRTAPPVPQRPRRRPLAGLLVGAGAVVAVVAVAVVLLVVLLGMPS